MLIGPIFTRELATAPLRPRFYAVPGLYLGAQLLLLFAAWMLLAGTQDLRTGADTARFGATIFPILALLQLTMAVFFSAIFAAGTIAQEKDRRTLILLLLTRLNNCELVLGRLCASLLPLAISVAATIPFWILLRGLGGITLAQIANCTLVSVATIAAAGSLGSLIAYWREKTFLILALTVLVLCAWLGFWTAVDAGLFGEVWRGTSTKVWASAFGPLQALWAALKPLPNQVAGPFGLSNAVAEFALVCAALTLILNGVAIFGLRIWNPAREAAPRSESEASPAGDSAARRDIHAAPGRTRTVWDNPILWREARTWAYGKRILLVKFVYLAFFAVALLGLRSLDAGIGSSQVLAAVLGPLFVLSLILVNALAVNSIANERDLGSLDLLLVTDLSPKEFVYGKLGGIFYGAKEMLALPHALIVGLWSIGVLRGLEACYLSGGLFALQAFVAMLGVHIGLAYDNSRQAIAVSLGIVFFLLVGVGTCMRIMIAFSHSSLAMQLIAFSAVILCGSLLLYAALGVRNPSGALLTASLICPIATFAAIMQFLGGDTFSVFFVVVGTYGMATAAMLIPAIDAFDVATGRTTE